MQPVRRRLSIALASLPLLASFRAGAQGQLKAGADFIELKAPQPVEAPPGKIEVIEFFWYGCPHCYSLEPALENWVKKLPPDVLFRRIPAVFNARWEHDATIFYTFDALGVLDKMHRPFFDSIHKDALKTDNMQALSQWLERRGVDPKKFEETYKSFGVRSKVSRAKQVMSGYRIEGTPTMGVHGRYTVSPDQGKTQDGILQHVDYLVGLARQNIRK